MPDSLRIIGLLLAGYFLSRSYFIRFWLDRLEPTRLLLWCAGFGLILYGIVATAGAERLASTFASALPADLDVRTVSAVLLSLLLAYGGNLVLWLIDHNVETNFRIQTAIRVDAGFHRLILEAMRDQNLVTLTLDTRKVYVGYVVQAPTLRLEDAFVSLLPIYSGFRDQNTQEFVLTNDYQQIYEELLAADDFDRSYPEFRLTLMLRDIRAASLFDDDVYAMFGEPQSGEPETSPGYEIHLRHRSDPLLLAGTSAVARGIGSKFATPAP